MMRTSGFMLLTSLFLGVGAPALGQRTYPAPVHPDTLPTLRLKWRLPASLSPAVVNAYAPRMALSGSMLYVFDHHGRRLAAVEVPTGKVTWHAPVPSRSDRAFAVTPLIGLNRVFVATDGYLYAFEESSGKPQWRLGTKGIAVNGIARSKHRLLLAWITVSGRQAQPGVHLWAVDARNGRVDWTKKLPGVTAYLEGDADGTYYLSDNGVVLGLTSDRGDPKWQLRIMGKITTPPQLKQGLLYVTSLQHKAGWQGTVLSAIDVSKGKIRWSVKIPSTLVNTFLHEDELMTVDSRGELARYDAQGKKTFELQLGFGDEPSSLYGVAAGERVYVFSRHRDGHGTIRLVDVKKKRIVAAANALGMNARSMLQGGNLLLLDGEDGDVYAYRMDRSQRPRRATVSPEEFARELLGGMKEAKGPHRGVPLKLAGLGAKALPAIEDGLGSPNLFVVDAAATAIGLIGNKRSVPALLKALARLEGAPSTAKVDPLVSIIDSLAEIRDGRAILMLQRLMRSEAQAHSRRRAAYVALGAIGTPAALAPIWDFRATKLVPSVKWDPLTFTPSYEPGVEVDVEADPESWPEAIRRETAVTVQSKGGQVYTAALSPYLGGYNDVWFGQSDLSGVMTMPFFSGVTRPEVLPNRRIGLRDLSVDEKGEIALVLTHREKGRWVPSQRVKLNLGLLALDSDRDKLSDLIEKRLRLSLHHGDTDGDGLKDHEDLNPLASGKLQPTAEQRLFREAFFTFYAFLKRRGIVVVDPGEGPSFELYGRKDPILSLRRTTIEKLRKEAGLHAADYVSFGGPYPEGGGSGDALPQVVWNKKKTEATIGMDIFRSGSNAVAYNVTLKRSGKNWVVARFFRVWTTN